MIVYPAAYIAENEKLENTPATIVEIVTDGIEDGTSPGDQLDINGSPTATVTSGVGHSDQVHILASVTFAQPGFSTAYQSFKMPTFRSANITSVLFWLKTVGVEDDSFSGTLFVQIFQDQALTIALTNERSVGISVSISSSSHSISFSGENSNFLDTITYYARIRVTGSFNDVLLNLELMGATAGGYADGQLNGGSRDADFTFSLGTLFDNYITPTVEIYDLDIGETPVNNGEWTIKDTAETGSSTTYTAEASATGAFSGEETSLGTIVDGDAITTLEQFYRITATLVTTVPHNTPTVVQIKAVFEVLLTISDTNFFGHSTDLKSVSTITKTIDDFKASTIGQVTFVTDYSPTIRDFIETKFPKGNTVKFKRGFVSPTFSVNDFIDHYLGRIENWVVNGDDTITFTLKDFQRDLSTKIPIIGTDGATTDIDYTAQHPVTVMLDIIQNRVGIRTSKVDVASFDAVVTALSGWTVTRNAANNTALVDPEEAQKLLEELRIITNTYFIPQNDGRIVLKQWDPDEAPVRTFLEQDFLLPPLSSNANLPSLFNFVLIYYDWDGDGNEPSDFAQGSGSVDATSLANWGLTEIKQLKDKWTLAAQTSQIETVRDNLQNRYKDPPQLVSAVVDSKNSDLEVGDVVSAAHTRITKVGAENWAEIGEDLPFIVQAHLLHGDDKWVLIGGHNQAGVTDDNIYSSATLLNWSTESEVFPNRIEGGSALEVETNLYIFGGFFTGPTTFVNSVYTATKAAPTTWTDSGGNLPAVNASSSVIIVGTDIYLLGGITTGGTRVDVIWSSTIADPTTWVDESPSVLPFAMDASSIAKIGDNLYLFGGLDSGAVPINNILTATAADPTTWTDTGKTIPDPLGYSSIYVGTEYIYLFGGLTTGPIRTKKIYRALLSDPLSWVTIKATLPDVLDKSTIAENGNSLYLVTGENLDTDGDNFGDIYISPIGLNTLDFQIVSVNPTSRNKINLKLLGMGA